MKKEKSTKDIRPVVNIDNNIGKNIENTVKKIVSKTTRALTYGDELAYEDREPGFILDETRR